MAETKGIIYSAWLAYLNKYCGKDAVTEAIKALSEEDRVQLSSPFLPSSWYPYSLVFPLERLTIQLANPTDTALSFNIGKYTAEYVFTGVYYSCLAKDPIQMVEKFKWVKDFFYQDSLKLETEITGESQCLIRYRYDAEAKSYRGRCEGLRGFWSKTLEMSGAPRVRSSHPTCVRKRATCCEFVMQW